jgi:hypothetical protein
MERIKQFFADSKQVNFTLAWFVRVAMLLLMLRRTFFNNTRVERVYINDAPYRDSIVVLKQQLLVLQKHDSLISYQYEKINSAIDSMHIDELKSYITNNIR